MLNVDDIRSRFPNPVSSIGANPDEGYCVGGAFCKYTGKVDWNFPVEWNFPEADDLQRVLMEENNTLTFDDAEYFAETIIEYNDAGEMQEAWDALERALKFDGGTYDAL